MPGIKPRHIPNMENRPCRRCLFADFAASFCIFILRLSYSSHTAFMGFNENVGASFCGSTPLAAETPASCSICCRGTRNRSSPNCTRLFEVIPLLTTWLPSTKVTFCAFMFSMLILLPLTEILQCRRLTDNGTAPAWPILNSRPPTIQCRRRAPSSLPIIISIVFDFILHWFEFGLEPVRRECPLAVWVLPSIYRVERWSEHHRSQQGFAAEVAPYI